DQLETGYRARRFRTGGSLYLDLEDAAMFEGAYYDDGRLWLITSTTPLPASPDTTHLSYIPPSPLTSSWGFMLDTASRVPVIQGPLEDEVVLPDTCVPWPHGGYFSLGDVDGDGRDEIAGIVFHSYIGWATSDKKMMVTDADGTPLDGFPVVANFQSPVLMANLRDDIRPELVVAERGDIAVYSPEGQLLKRLGLHAQPDELFLFHTADGKVGLANGDRIHWFEPSHLNPQWVTLEGRHSQSRYSLNDGTHLVPQPTVLDKARVYNYPNPVTEGHTTIRFYTGSASLATIHIYTIDGLLVVKKQLSNLATNGYNEWVWEVGDNPSGLYYAVVEVAGADKVSALIKIAIVR
ncbi:MAG: T9SS type A sorting domain-containing protein, partial [Candidatus Neomarinimicrobiota bacterium]